MRRGSAPRWAALSAEWRAKQFEYTWVRSLTGAAHHEDFWLCTRDALDFVLARNGIRDRALARDLMQAYRVLPPYPEVPAMLRAAARTGHRHRHPVERHAGHAGRCAGRRRPRRRWSTRC